MSTPVARSAAPVVVKAVYKTMMLDPDLQELVAGRVFDHVPEKKILPYVTVGDTVETPDNTLDTFGHVNLISLHVWSDYRGYAEALTIADRLVALFDHQPLALDGHRHIVTRREPTQTLRDPDPTIRHVPVRLRVITEQE